MVSQNWRAERDARESAQIAGFRADAKERIAQGEEGGYYPGSYTDRLGHERELFPDGQPARKGFLGRLFG